MEELSLATKNFSDKNLIGEGKFGDVYKGLLHDGMLVAIKKRPGAPTQEFIDEVFFKFCPTTACSIWSQVYMYEIQFANSIFFFKVLALNSEDGRDHTLGLAHRLWIG